MDELRDIADGWTGTDETVQAIYGLVNESLTDPLVVRAARAVVRNVPERDQLAESKAISAYIRSHVRYTRESVETLASPAEMVRDIQAHGRTTGDCDEFTTLSMAFHKIIGIPVRAVVISQREDKVASHIFGQAFIKGRGWVTMDDIVKRKPYGWAAPMKDRSLTKTYDVAGLGDFEEGSQMNGSRMVGRTRMVRSDFLMPRRQFMIGPSVASSSFRLKPSGMIYAGDDGSLSGVGVDPELGLDISSLITTASTVAANVKTAVAAAKGAKTPAAAPAKAAKPAGSAINPQMLLLGGLALGGLWFFFKKKR